MPLTNNHTEALTGLSNSEATALQKQYGNNKMTAVNERGLLHIIFNIIKEPMFVLLSAACIIYFVLGELQEGSLMLAAMLLVTAISLYQEARSSHALKTLQQYTQPGVQVVRDGQLQSLAATALVPGDIVLLEEGNQVPADAIVLRSNDLSVNESVMTGESAPAAKDETSEHHQLYQGTTINAGQCYAQVTETGNRTQLARLGKSISGISTPPTLLQQQLNRFVRRLAIFGLIAFLLIWLFNYLANGSITQSLLLGLTLAMAAIPEEIPVAFSSFMALGAYQMAKIGIITRQPQTIENLGAMSVLCLDKTGTITENRMEVQRIYLLGGNTTLDASVQREDSKRVLQYAVLASEAHPFDAMEKAIHQALAKQEEYGMTAACTMIHEYPLEGRPPMMTHVYQQGSQTIAAGKGAVERIVAICKLNAAEDELVHNNMKTLAASGYRVIAVASAVAGETLPATQDDFNWQFEGLIGLYDPPKKNAAVAFEQFYRAGISIKMITGDYAATAMNIAAQTGMRDATRFCTGDEVMQLSQEALQHKVQDTHIFARMFPEAKLRVIEALKANGEIVGMTGDGVNDGPALKSANIGIAMGKKGTEIARQSADLVLTDDDLLKVVDAVAYGRKIFSNLKKAVRYIISIHIPIILTASLPLLLGWRYPTIFTPIHVIFLELIMGPTCSIFYEREPAAPGIMLQPPRKRSISMFTKGELLVSIVQGLAIALAVLIVYYFSMQRGDAIATTRTMVFTGLLCSNIFLTFSNRSFTQSAFHTLRYRNNLVPYVLGASLLFLAAVLLIAPVRSLFLLAPLSGMQLLTAAGAGFAGVIWFELYKMYRRAGS
jgi:P-type Ca2+ transporter type 2C